MTTRRAPGKRPAVEIDIVTTPPASDGGEQASASRPVAPAPVAHSRDEAYELYTAARDAWTAAMRAASSGKAADLAALAVVQEAYEAATAELDRWDSGDMVNFPVEPESHSPVDAVVGQELAWRKVRAPHDEPGLLGRLVRRLRR